MVNTNYQFIILTSFDNAKFPSHELFINSLSQVKMTYKTSTGWGGVGFYSPEEESVIVDLVPGLNSIRLIKTSGNDYWCELDYLKLSKIEGETYVPYVEEEPSTRLEAENFLGEGVNILYFNDQIYAH